MFQTFQASAEVKQASSRGGGDHDDGGVNDVIDGGNSDDDREEKGDGGSGDSDGGDGGDHRTSKSRKSSKGAGLKSSLEGGKVLGRLWAWGRSAAGRLGVGDPEAFRATLVHSEVRGGPKESTDGTVATASPMEPLRGKGACSGGRGTVAMRERCVPAVEFYKTMAAVFFDDGYSTFYSPVPVPFNPFAAMAAGAEHSGGKEGGVDWGALSSGGELCLRGVAAGGAHAFVYATHTPGWGASSDKADEGKDIAALQFPETRRRVNTGGWKKWTRCRNTGCGTTLPDELAVWHNTLCTKPPPPPPALDSAVRNAAVVDSLSPAAPAGGPSSGAEAAGSGGIFRLLPGSDESKRAEEVTLPPLLGSQSSSLIPKVDAGSGGGGGNCSREAATRQGDPDGNTSSLQGIPRSHSAGDLPSLHQAPKLSQCSSAENIGKARDENGYSSPTSPKTRTYKKRVGGGFIWVTELIKPR